MSTPSHPASSSFAGWPGGKRAAVSLSFDDAAVSQLDYVVPILNRYGVRGTFYVTPGDGSIFVQHIDRWRPVHAAGHEIGNHTVLHPCSAKRPWITPDLALEGYTLQQIEAEIDDATRRLQELLPGYEPTTFAYPCGDTFVGDGEDRVSYIPSVARRFVAARGVGSSDNDPATCDLHNVSSWLVENVTAEQMIAMIQPTIEAGRWAIFCFHGVGGDHLRVEAEALEGLVRYLKEREDEIWTDTVYAIGKYVAQARTSPAAK